MATKHVNELYSAYLDGTLPTAVRQNMEAHLQQCPQCTRELAEMRLLLAEISDLAPVTVPDGLIAAIQQKLPAAPAPQSRKWLVPSFVGGALAAAVLLLVVLMNPQVPTDQITMVKEAPHYINKNSKNAPVASADKTNEVSPKAQSTNHKRIIIPVKRQQIASINPIGAERTTFDKMEIDDPTAVETDTYAMDEINAPLNTEPELTIHSADLTDNINGASGLDVPYARAYRFNDSNLLHDTPTRPTAISTKANVVGNSPLAPAMPFEGMPGGKDAPIMASGQGASVPDFNAPVLCNQNNGLNFLIPPTIISQSIFPAETEAIASASSLSQFSLRNAQSLTIGQLDITISEESRPAASDAYNINLSINGKPRPCLYLRYAYPETAGKSFALPKIKNEANIVLPASTTGTALEFSLAGNLTIDRFYLVIPPAANNEPALTDENEAGTMVGVLLQTSRERGLFILSPAAFAELIVNKAKGDSPLSLEIIAKEAGYRLEAQNNLLNITPNK